MSGSLSLITGAGGFIGNRLRHPEDRALVRRAVTAGEMVGDLTDYESLQRACEGVGRVFHCAGYAHAYSPLESSTHWRINYEGTRNLLNAAGKAGVRSFVFLSSVKAMAEPGDQCVSESWPGEPQTPYGYAKRAAENEVLEAGAKYGMHVVNLRLAMVYGRGGRGNLERMARAVRSGWFPPLPETSNRRSIVHVQDVVEVMRLVVERPEANGMTYIVADSRAYSGRELYEAIRLALGLSPTHMFTVPVGLMLAAGRLNRRLGHTIDRLIDSACYSPARIELELGWRSRLTLSEGLREMLGMLPA